MSALMILILLQVSITYMYVRPFFQDHGKNVNEYEYPYKLKPQNTAVPSRTHVSVTNLPAPGIETNYRVHHRTFNQNKLLKDQSVSEYKHLVSKVRVHQSKWLLHLFSKSRYYCNEKIEILDNVTALFRNVIVDPSLASVGANSTVRIQDGEFYRLEKGFMTVDNCSNMPTNKNLYIDGGSSHHIKQLNKAVVLSKDPMKINRTMQEYESDFVIMTTRYEYANVYWTVTDLYNAFLMLQLYNRTFNNTDLLIFDAHPQTQLDDIFDGVFRRVLRPNDLRGTTRFRNLLQCFQRGKSPMLRQIHTPLPLINEFRYQALSALQIQLSSLEDRQMRCQAKRLNVLFIWRRNYVAHPRNPRGMIARKISNEGELLNATKQRFPKYNITGKQLDKYPVRTQLDIMSKADIMVGMHGAAFGFVVFMQEGSGVLEMWPKGVKENWHMEYLAKRNGLYYQSWKNMDERNENREQKKTRVSAQTVNKIVEELTISVCSKYTG